MGSHFNFNVNGKLIPLIGNANVLRAYLLSYLHNPASGKFGNLQNNSSIKKLQKALWHTACLLGFQFTAGPQTEHIQIRKAGE